MGIFTFTENMGVRIGSAPLVARARSGKAEDIDPSSPVTWLTDQKRPGWALQAKYELIAAHPVVDAALRKHADAEANIALKVYNRKDKSPLEGPFADLVAWPAEIGPHRMRWWIAVTRRKYGVAYLALMRNAAGAVIEMIPVSPTAMDWDDDRQRFVFRAKSGVEILFERRDVWVVPNHLGDSGRLISGVSSLETLRKMVDSDNALADAIYGWWERGTRPGIVMTHPSQLSDKARENLQMAWSSQHEGAKNAGRSVLLEEGMTVTALPFNAVDAQLTETRSMLWNEACIALDVPGQLIHINDATTADNKSTETLKGWYRDIVSPQLRYLEDDWHRFALNQFGAPAARALVEHDVDSILWGAPIDRVEALAKADHLTVAEKRRIDNLPAIEGTDRILVNGAMVPLDKIDAWVDGRGQSASAQSPGTPETPPAKSVWRREDIDGVLAAVSRKASVGEIDMGALTSGLPDSCAEDLGVIAALSGSMKQFRSHVKALEER
jgi:HK97 family phage portal protein